MRRGSIRGVWLLFCLLPLCLGGKPRYVAGHHDDFPRIRFTDGKTSCNDRCPVSRTKLSRKMQPLYVNDEPVGFC